MDVLSDVLRAVHMTGALYFDLYFRAPWVAETPAAERIRPAVMPGFEHMILFHLVLDGADCWSGSSEPDQPPIRLQAGDVVICTNGVAHYMGSDRDARSRANEDLYYKPRETPLPFVYHELGGQGAATHLACGYFGFDVKPFNPILGALPELFSVRCRGTQGELIRRLFRAALDETQAPRSGSEAILATLSELMFLHAVRQHVDGLVPEATGWLAGLRDPHVHAAMRLMHGHPSRAWTVEMLAGAVGMSRSTFADHFARFVAMPPMQYLARWRLQLASDLLDRPGISIEQVADRVGYESAASFNRAFKRQVGMPPGAWRRRRRALASAARATV